MATTVIVASYTVRITIEQDVDIEGREPVTPMPIEIEGLIEDAIADEYLDIMAGQTVVAIASWDKVPA